VYSKLPSGFRLKIPFVTPEVNETVRVSDSASSSFANTPGGVQWLEFHLHLFRRNHHLQQVVCLKQIQL